MSIDALVKELDEQLMAKWEQYLNLHKELDSHRGKPLDDTNLGEVNRLLKEIQFVFTELYPIFVLVMSRNDLATNAMAGFNTFIESLKKAGALQDTPPEPVVEN